MSSEIAKVNKEESVSAANGDSSGRVLTTIATNTGPPLLDLRRAHRGCHTAFMRS